MIMRKLSTAKEVLFSRGIGDVFKLLAKNIKLYSLRASRFAVSRLWNAVRILTRNNDKKNGIINVLYIADRLETENGLTIRYRIFNLREALGTGMHTKFEIIENGIYKHACSIAWADIIVLMRLEWSPMVETVVKTAKRNDIPVVYDIDDIIFRQDYSEKFCSILSDGTQNDTDKYKNIFLRQSQTYSHSDYATTSTQYIADIMKSDGKRAYVIHNGLNDKQIKISHDLCDDNKTTERYIGYLSGSATHNKDFSQAAPALARILKEYNDVKLRIIGYLELSDLEACFPGRIETMDFMKWDKLLRVSAANFINIAPLDIDNPFCHAKSELKYFESAIVRVPTVASATETYKQCIVNGINGLLASNDDEWYLSVKALLDDNELYKSISNHAYTNAIEHYAPKAIANEVVLCYQSIINDYKSNRIK